MRLLVFGFVISIAFVNVSGAIAQEKVYISDSDSRLAQTVEYEVWGEPLSTVIEELSSKYNVKLFCGSSKSDFRVLDQRVDIRVKDISLGKLMASIARTLKMKWLINENEDDKQPSYRIVADRKIWDAAIKESELQEQMYYQMRKQAIDAYLNLANLKPQQIEDLQQSNPLLYVAAKTGIAPELAVVVNSIPGLYDSIVNNKDFHITGYNLTPKTLNALDKLNNNWSKIQMGFGIRLQSAGLFNGEAKNLEINFSRDRTWQKIPGSIPSTLGSLSIFGDGSYSGFELINPYSKESALLGEYCNQVLEMKQFSFKDMLKALQPLLFSQMVSFTILARPEYSEFKELYETISIKKTALANLHSYLKAFADACKINIVASNHSLYPNTYGSFPYVQSGKIIEILQYASNSYYIDWQYNDGIIEIIGKDWGSVIRNLMPDRLIKPYQDEKIKHQYLSFQSILNLTSLNPDSIAVNLTDCPILEEDRLARNSFHVDYIAFINSLDGLQMLAFTRKEGISTAELTDAQIEQLAYLMRIKSDKEYNDLLQKGFITFKEFNNNDQVENYIYIFKIGDEERYVGVFSSRRYIKPQTP